MYIYTKQSKQVIAVKHERTVFGKRGPYVEFDFRRVFKNNLYIPKKEEWRISSADAYYVEYRTTIDNVMVYHQKRTVTYADYKIGMLYISPKDLWNSRIFLNP